jgi:hypothetical protein
MLYSKVLTPSRILLRGGEARILVRRSVCRHALIRCSRSPKFALQVMDWTSLFKILQRYSDVSDPYPCSRVVDYTIVSYGRNLDCVNLATGFEPAQPRYLPVCNTIQIVLRGSTRSAPNVQTSGCQTLFCPSFCEPLLMNTLCVVCHLAAVVVI